MWHSDISVLSGSVWVVVFRFQINAGDGAGRVFPLYAVESCIHGSDLEGVLTNMPALYTARFCGEQELLRPIEDAFRRVPGAIR